MAVEQAGDTGPNGTNSAQTVIFISLGYGMSLLVTAWGLYRISGGLFNPAVTLGLCIAGALPWLRGTSLSICLVSLTQLGLMLETNRLDPLPCSDSRRHLRRRGGVMHHSRRHRHRPHRALPGHVGCPGRVL